MRGVKKMNKNETMFTLNSDCFLIKGVKRGAIYNLDTGDVYSIDENSVKILDKCEKGISIFIFGSDCSLFSKLNIVSLDLFFR